MRDSAPRAFYFFIIAVIALAISGTLVIQLGGERAPMMAWAAFLGSMLAGAIFLLYIKGSERFVSVTMFAFALGLGYWYRTEWGLILTAATALAVISRYLHGRPKRPPSTT